MNFWRILLVLFILVGCKPSEARRPLQQNSGRFIDTSVQINKARNNQEYTAIQKLVDAAKTPFHVSDYGFWYQFTKKNEQERYTPQFGDQVLYSYGIKNLAKKWIYPTDESVKKTYFVAQEELIAGLREGLKLMKKGESATFIFPSQMAYGYYGDDDKIGTNTPLIYEVTVHDIIKN